MPYFEKMIPINEAAERSFYQTFDAMGSRSHNPFVVYYYKMTGKLAGFTELEKISDYNAENVRTGIRNFIRKRASGEIKSDVGAKSDLVSLMLESSDTFTEDDIIDECIDLMIAGT